MSTNRTEHRLTPELWPVFDKAWIHAVEAFSKMLNTTVTHRTFFAGVRVLPSANLGSFLPVPEESCAYVITTELLGGLTGKSYLVLSHRDIGSLAGATGLKDTVVQEAFLKELDNILSAAVITVLSNELNVKVYGDVPILSRDSHRVIREDLSSYSGLFFVSAITPEARGGSLIPTFLWVIDLKSLNQTTSFQPASNVL